MLPPSLASPSLSASASASASASDLPRPTSPPSRRRSTYHRGRQVQTTVPVAQRCNITGEGHWPPPHPCVYVPPKYSRVKKLQLLIINKDVRKCLARKNVNDILIWSWNNSPLNASMFCFNQKYILSSNPVVYMRNHGPIRLRNSPCFISGISCLFIPSSIVYLVHFFGGRCSDTIRTNGMTCEINSFNFSSVCSLPS